VGSAKSRGIRKSQRIPPSHVLLRGLEVLNQRQVTRVSVLVEATGLPRASVVRMLRLLESETFVRRLPKRRGYSVDERVLALSAGYRREDAAITAARPILSAFTAEITSNAVLKPASVPRQAMAGTIIL
jgi:DNA-binding IclR family transcriptional regulator